MDTFTTEQALRREAIRRRLQGERPSDIYRDLGRSRRWFAKWWAEYQQNPMIDFADRSRAPQPSPHKTPEHIEQAIVNARQTLEAADKPDTKYGLIGAHAVCSHLNHLGIGPLPSDWTIQRILARHDLTHPIGAGSDSAYYPPGHLFQEESHDPFVDTCWADTPALMQYGHGGLMHNVLQQNTDAAYQPQIITLHNRLRLLHHNLYQCFTPMNLA